MEMDDRGTNKPSSRLLDLCAHPTLHWCVSSDLSQLISLKVLQEIDAGIRRLLYALPTNLRCPDLPANAFRLERPGAPIVPAPPSRIDDDFFPSQAIHDHRSLPDDVIIRQRIRLAMHFCMLFCEYLLRSALQLLT